MCDNNPFMPDIVAHVALKVISHIADNMYGDVCVTREEYEAVVNWEAKAPHEYQWTISEFIRCSK